MDISKVIFASQGYFCLAKRKGKKPETMLSAARSLSARSSLAPFWGHGRPRVRVMDVRAHMFVFQRFEGLPEVFDPGRLPDCRSISQPKNFSASPKPHPSKPHPCNMPPAKTEAALQMPRCRRCTATLAFLQCGSHFHEKLRCSKRKTAVQHWKSCVTGSAAFREWKFSPKFFWPKLLEIP